MTIEEKWLNRLNIMDNVMFPEVDSRHKYKMKRYIGKHFRRWLWSQNRLQCNPVFHFYYR